ncbi:MAG: hypothetical protein WCS37_19060 [Chloroflexota bacterium]
MSQAITVNLPEPVYQRLKERAAQTQRSVENELLDDKTLWQAARTHLSTKLIGRMEKLHDKRRNDTLTIAEEKELTDLLKDYEKAIVLRSEAMGILLERGYDISKLTNKKIA